MTPSQLRLQWNYITRELRLTPPLKLILILLVIANFTGPRSRTANLPISLIVHDSGLRDQELQHLLVSLESAQWLNSIWSTDQVEQPPVLLYNLSPHLI